MGCQEIVLAQTEPAYVQTPPPRRATPPPMPGAVALIEPPATRPSPPPPVPEAIPGLSCPCCEADAVLELPPDANSRNPGFVCAMCRTPMRPPGTMGNYYAAALLGMVIGLLGVGLVVVALKASLNRNVMIGGGAAVAGLGAVVAGWAFQQTRRPIPVGAKPAPARFGFWLGILFSSVSVLGAGILALMYILRELR